MNKQNRRQKPLLVFNAGLKHIPDQPHSIPKRLNINYHLRQFMEESTILLRQTLDNIVFRYNVVVTHFILAQHSSVIF